MSQLDLIAQLRESRPVAPAELRERIAHIAALAEEPKRRRRLTRRRALVLVLAVASLAAVAGALIPRDSQRSSNPDVVNAITPVQQEGLEVQPSNRSSRPPAFGMAADSSAGNSAKAAAPADSLEATIPPPSGTNAQKYSATLRLRLKDANAVSAATNKALQIVAAMGGHPNTVNVDAARRNGEAYLELKVPRARVQEAVQKLGALGTIIGANVSIQDLQAGLDATGRTIDRLKADLAELQAAEQTEDVVAQIETLSVRIARLQAEKARTIRAAYFATVKLHMQTPAAAKVVPTKDDDNGPLHGLGVAFTWIGIGAVYALALGLPFALLVWACWWLARLLRRRREEALLARA